MRRRILRVACAGTFLVLVNFTAPVSTVQTIGAALGSGASGQTWILGSISVGLAAFLLVAGSLADDIGRKRVFVLGGVLLAVSETLAALAPATLLFVLARIVQGAASAAILASSLGLLGHVFAPGPERVRATGLWGAMIGAGIAVGPLYTALLVEISPWPVAYWILAGAAAVTAAVAGVWLVESCADRRRPLDLPGVVALGGGIVLLISGLTEARGGWEQVHVLLLLAAGALLLGLFVLVEHRSAEPMLDLSLLRRPSFVGATLGAFLIGVAVIGFMTYVPIESQRVLGLSPLASAGLLAVWSGLSFVVAPQARQLVRYVGGRLQVVTGLAVCGVGQLVLVGITGESSWWQFVPGLVLAGIGSGVANAALAGLAVQSVPPSRAAMGSGANNTSRYLGSSIGVALVASIVALAPATDGTTAQFATGMTHAAIVTGVLAIVGAAVVAACRETDGAAPAAAD